MRNCSAFKLFSILVFLFLASESAAQLQPGFWMEHLPYYQARNVVEADKLIYCSTEKGLFYFDKKDNAVEKITRVQGLSDVGISSIQFIPQINTLVVAYQNANIDLIKNNQIVNIPDIKNKIMPGNKTINTIRYFDELVYLACGFGLVVLDPVRYQIKDTYFIGDDGLKTNVLDLVLFKDSFYAATENGILMANSKDPFLADFNRWEKCLSAPNPDGYYSQILLFKDNLLTLMVGEENQADMIYELQDGVWSVPLFYEPGKNRSIWTDGEVLVITRQYSLEAFDVDGERVYLIYQYNFGTMDLYRAIRDSEGYYWLADGKNGLVRSNNQWHSSSIIPNGPFRESAFNFAFSPKALFVAGGSKDQSLTQTYSNSGYYKYESGLWYNFNRDLTESYPSYLFDLTEIVVDPADADHIFAGSWGCGVLEFQNDVLVKVHNDSNSSLQTILPGFYVRIGGMAFDQNQNLWVTNSAVDNILSVYTKNGDWIAFPYGGTSNFSQTGRLVIDTNGFKWVILPRGEGLFVLDDNGTLENLQDDQYKKVIVRNEEGEVVNDIYSIAVDRDGLIWVGTNQGILVYYSPWSVFSATSIQANRIIVNLDGTPQPLLGTETINAIAVDGANRKWFGTQSGGAVLMSADGTQQIEQFTTGNSPLLSNTVLNIGINPETGELFFGTDKGISSYKGYATEPAASLSNIYVYPNPVRPNYEGDIIIKGTVDFTQVRITDIAGNVVFSTQSLGGQAVWNGRDYSGNKVATGVYLVYLTTRDGSATEVTKLLFVK